MSANKAKAETNGSALYEAQQCMCCNTVTFLKAMIISDSHSSI